MKEGEGEEEEENHQRMNVGCKAFTAIVWQTNTGTYIRLSLAWDAPIVLHCRCGGGEKRSSSSIGGGGTRQETSRPSGLEVEVELLSFPLKLFTGRAFRRCRRSLVVNSDTLECLAFLSHIAATCPASAEEKSLWFVRFKDKSCRS